MENEAQINSCNLLRVEFINKKEIINLKKRKCINTSFGSSTVDRTRFEPTRSSINSAGSFWHMRVKNAGALLLTTECVWLCDCVVVRLCAYVFVCLPDCELACLFYSLCVSVCVLLYFSMRMPVCVCARVFVCVWACECLSVWASGRLCIWASGRVSVRASGHVSVWPSRSASLCAWFSFGCVSACVLDGVSARMSVGVSMRVTMCACLYVWYASPAT